MNEADRSRIEETSGAASLLLSEIQKVLVPTATSRSREVAAFQELLRKRGKLAEKLPRGWLEGSLEQLVSAETLQEPSRTAAFLNAHGEDLSADAAAFLRRMITAPAFYAAFRVKERLEENLFAIVNAADGAEHALLSPSVEALWATGPLSYASLLVSNGACLQAIGLMHYYRGITAPDFHCFARMLRPQEYAAGGLAAVMKSQPEQFLMLDFLSEIPPIAYGGEPLVSYSSMVPAPGFDPAKLGEGFESAAKGGVTRLRLKGCEPPFSMADLYHDGDKGLLAAYAQREGDYARLALAAAGQAALPAEPQWTASKNMETACYMLLKKEMPALAYEKMFEEPKPAPDRDATLKRVNAFLEDVADNLNKGTPYAVAELAERHGVDPGTAAEAEAGIRKSFDRYRIDVEGGLPGIPAVSPDQIGRLMAGNRGHTLYSFHETDESRGLFQAIAPRVEALLKESTGKPRTVTLAGLPKALEELDFAFWRQERCIVLRYTLFLLHHKGGEFGDVGDYAAEVLKKFWQVLLKSKARADVRRFVKVYGIFGRETLGRSGLVEIREEDPRSDTRFAMKASPFLEAWIGTDRAAH